MSSPSLSFEQEIEKYAGAFYRKSIDHNPALQPSPSPYSPRYSGDFREFKKSLSFLSTIFRDSTIELESFRDRLFHSDSLMNEPDFEFARFAAVLILRLLSMQSYSSAHDPPLATRHVLSEKRQCLLEKVIHASKEFSEIFTGKYSCTIPLKSNTLAILRQLFTSWTKDMDIQTFQIAKITPEKSSRPPKTSSPKTLKASKSGQSKVSVILHRHVVSVKNDSVNSSSSASPLPLISGCASPTQPPRSSSPTKKSAFSRPNTPPARPPPCASPVRIPPRATCSPKSSRMPASSGLLPTPSPGILPTPPPYCSIAALRRTPAACFSPSAPALAPDTLAPILASYLAALLSTPCPLPPPSPRAPRWHCKPRIKV